MKYKLDTVMIGFIDVACNYYFFYKIHLVMCHNMVTTMYNNR